MKNKVPCTQVSDFSSLNSPPWISNYQLPDNLKEFILQIMTSTVEKYKLPTRPHGVKQALVIELSVS